MNSVWNLARDFENKFPMHPGMCRDVISKASSTTEIKKYLDFTLLRLKAGDKSALEEAWGAAIPLAYRLALDDSSANYRIASELKDAAFWLDEPILMKAAEKEISCMCKCVFGLDYDELLITEQEVLLSLSDFGIDLSKNWYIYSRRKKISSILTKLARFKIKEKLPKDKSPELLNAIEETLTIFDQQVIYRMNGLPVTDVIYDFNVVKWLLPDILAFTMQLKENEYDSLNLGSAKNKYKSVHRKFKSSHFDIYFGPSYSEDWHINRMVCYVKRNINTEQRIVFEFFVRTDLDYFIGYSNYWHYKDVELFTSTKFGTKSYQEQLVKRLRKCKSFSQVQDLIFEDLSTGQLQLF